jgi:hypothetical protein
MFKKIFNKQTIIAFILGGLIFSSMPVLADTMQYIFVQSNCKLMIDGKEYSNPDIPINLYLKDQSNYAPLAVFRDICTKLNIPFEYNNTTKEINITTIRKEETVLSETIPQTLATPVTPTNNLVAYEENGLTIVEISGIKFIKISSIDEKLKNTNYKMSYVIPNQLVLKYNNLDLSTKINIYSNANRWEHSYKLPDNFIYILYEDWINIINPLIKE